MDQDQKVRNFFLSLTESNLSEEEIVDRNAEFKIGYDRCSFDPSKKEFIPIVATDVGRMNMFLYYGRHLFHANAYFQRNLFSPDKDVITTMLAAKLDIIFCMSKIAGHDPIIYDFRAMTNAPIESIALAIGDSAFTTSYYLNHALIYIEDRLNWSMVKEGENDWQSVREGMNLLYTILASECVVLDIGYDELFSRLLVEIDKREFKRSE